MNHPLSDMMTSSMGKIRDMIDVNTVIGDPISAGDVTIIPVTKVSIGYGAGGSDFATNAATKRQDGRASARPAARGTALWNLKTRSLRQIRRAVGQSLP